MFNMKLLGQKILNFNKPNFLSQKFSKILSYIPLMFYSTSKNSSLMKLSQRQKCNQLIFNNSKNFASNNDKNTGNINNKTRFGQEFCVSKEPQTACVSDPSQNSALNIDLTKLSPHCYIEQIQTPCLSQYGYYIESDGKAMVIDPVRDISYYIELLNKRNAKLKFIGETHFHADFVSGHVDLSDQTHAKIIFGPGAEADFPIVKTTNEMIFDLSEKISVQLLHTPGHTLESCCFAVLERTDSDVRPFKTLAVTTGDTLFLGDVGRPDLAVKSNLTSRDLAAMLYESIKSLKKLPDDCVVLPGHGAGSACGKNIQKGSFSTVGLQKQTNYAMNDSLKKEEFIEIVISNLPSPPQYFFYDAMLNKKSLGSIKQIISNSSTPLEPLEFYNLLKKPGYKVLDCRSHSVIYEQGTVPNAYCIDLSMTYAIWTATLMNHTDKILLVCEKEKIEEAITRMARVGYENVEGVLAGGFANWKANNLPINKISSISATKVIEQLKHNQPIIVDVRHAHEYLAPGIVPGSIQIPLPVLEKNLNKIPKNKPLQILCKGGMRAFIAASILVSNGFDNNVSVIEGGIDRLIASGFKPTPKEDGLKI